MRTHRIVPLLLLLLGSLSINSARAETHATCTGFIDSIPATINTQGVWCLRKDASTSVTSGAAITVNTNNVTIDCNGFKVGGLAAGNGSKTSGIFADGRQNTTIRRCNLRGFHHGILLQGDTGGHLVEHNRIDNSLAVGIDVRGSRNLIQHNSVFDTGGAPDSFSSIAISAGGDVVDNQVEGVFAVWADAYVFGIDLTDATGTARDNRIRNLTPNGSGRAIGISGLANASSAVGNHVAAAYFVVQGVGISSIRACANNTVASFTTSYSCSASVGNL